MSRAKKEEGFGKGVIVPKPHRTETRGGEYGLADGASAGSIPACSESQDKAKAGCSFLTGRVHALPGEPSLSFARMPTSGEQKLGLTCLHMSPTPRTVPGISVTFVERMKA